MKSRHLKIETGAAGGWRDAAIGVQLGSMFSDDCGPGG